MSDYFTRALTLAQVNECVDALSEAAGFAFKRVARDTETFTYYAPDGDIVLTGMLIHGAYLTRFHKDVFDQQG